MEHSSWFVIKPKEKDVLHYGVKKQKHGVRRYQNKDGSLTPLGREHYGVGDPRKSSSKNDPDDYAREMLKKNEEALNRASGSSSSSSNSSGSGDLSGGRWKNIKVNDLEFRSGGGGNKKPPDGTKSTTDDDDNQKRQLPAIRSNGDLTRSDGSTSRQESSGSESEREKRRKTGMDFDGDTYREEQSRSQQREERYSGTVEGEGNSSSRRRQQQSTRSARDDEPVDAEYREVGSNSGKAKKDKTPKEPKASKNEAMDAEYRQVSRAEEERKLAKQDQLLSKGMSAGKTMSEDLSKFVSKSADRATKKKMAKMDVSWMSDQELRDRINRYNLEQQYKSISVGDVAKGRKSLQSMLELSGTVLAVGASAATIASIIHEMRKG